MVAARKCVFINVPFDPAYEKVFKALVFAIHDCGLHARCALEGDDGSQVRIDKLYKLIQSCRYGVHDLSRTALDAKSKLPRFNMPLELGLFLGAKRFGNSAQRMKSCLILDTKRYRFQVFCSDIAGQDIRAHANKVESAVGAVRNWLASAHQGDGHFPGPGSIVSRHMEFQDQLPDMCAERHLDVGDLSFVDYRNLVRGWLAVNARA